MFSTTQNFKYIEWKYLSYAKNRSAFKVKEVVSSYFSNPGYVFDIGCGAGGLSCFFKKYYGIELEFPALKKTLETKVDNDHFFVCADVKHLPFKDNCIDNFISVNMLEHVQNPDSIIKEIYRSACDKGIFILPCIDTLPFFYDPINYIRIRCRLKTLKRGAFGFGHINILSLEEWRRLILEAGFKIQRIIPYDNLLLAQIEFFLFSLIYTAPSNYSELPIKLVVRSLYDTFNFIHNILSLFDLKIKKSFSLCFLVSK